jgi:hypothetical protein
VIEIGVEIYFYFDMVFNFLTTYEDENMKIVVAPKAIARNYLRGWFLVDIISGDPLEHVSFYWSEVEYIPNTCTSIGQKWSKFLVDLIPGELSKMADNKTTELHKQLDHFSPIYSNSMQQASYINSLATSLLYN